MDVSKDIIGCISKVQVKINGLRQERFSCSQATFIGICRTVGCNQTDEELMALSAGFRGGMGCSYNEGSCGAFAAGIMALGMFLPKDNAKAVALSKELFNHLKKRYGTVICGNIVYRNGFVECTDCCLCVGKKVVELLYREKVPTLKSLTK